MGLFSKDITNMEDLFVHTLRDIYYAEKQIEKALRHYAQALRVFTRADFPEQWAMAQNNRASLVEKAPWLDIVAGPDSYRRLPELVGRAGFDPAPVYGTLTTLVSFNGSDGVYPYAGLTSDAKAGRSAMRAATSAISSAPRCMSGSSGRR